MAALLENSFAFLDGEEDDAKIIETAKAVAKEKKILNQQSEQAVKVAQRCRSAPLSMGAKRIILPRYIRRRDIVVRKEKPDGAEQNDAGSNFSGGIGDRGSDKGVDSYQGNNHRRDGNDYKGSYGRRGGYRGNNRRGKNNSGYKESGNGSRDGDNYRNNGGNNVGKNNSGDSLGVVDNDGWQISGRRRVGHLGQSRGYNVHTNGHDDNTLVKAAEGQAIEKPKSGEFEPDERHENGNMLSGISENDLSSVQHAVDGENKRIVAETHLDDDTEAEAIHSDVRREDVADATTDGPKESKRSKRSTKKTQIQNTPVNKAEEGEDDSNKMTLEEYERVQLERGKSLESLKRFEQRQVTLDKDFESMHLVGKKSEDGFIKPNTGQELLQRKDGPNKEEKAPKSMSINEFLKLAEVRSWEMSDHQRKPPPKKNRAGNAGNLSENGRGRGRVYDEEKMNGGQQHHRPGSARGFVGERIPGGRRQGRSYNGHRHGGERTNGGLQHQRSYNGRGPRHPDGRKQKGSNGGGESGKPNGSQHQRPDFHHRAGYAVPAGRLDDCEPRHERPCNNELGKGKELNVEDPNQFPALGSGTRA